MYRAFIALLFVGGVGAALVGTLLPQGGGTTLVALGSASFGSALTLVGLAISREVGRPRSNSRS